MRVRDVPDRLVAGMRRRAGGLILALVVAGPAHGSEPSVGSGDSELRERIEARLSALSDETGAEIRAVVRGGDVVLQGQVGLLEHSLRAEQTVWTTPGVRDVDNEVRVVALAGGGDDAIERQVRRIIKGSGRFIDTNLEVDVTSGAVRVRGMFQDPVDVLALKHRIASIPGVLDVEIDALLVALRGAPQAVPDS